MNVVIIASYLLMPRLTFILLTRLISHNDTRYTMSNIINLLFSSFSLTLCCVKMVLNQTDYIY